MSHEHDILEEYRSSDRKRRLAMWCHFTQLREQFDAFERSLLSATADYKRILRTGHKNSQNSFPEAPYSRMYRKLFR